MLWSKFIVEVVGHYLKVPVGVTGHDFFIPKLVSVWQKEEEMLFAAIRAFFGGFRLQLQDWVWCVATVDPPQYYWDC